MSIPHITKSGERLKIIDGHIMRLVRKRMLIASQVGAFKEQQSEGGIVDPIFRPDIEDKRIKEMGELAQEIGLNPHFARGLEYDLINESCKVQMTQLQSEDKSYRLPTDPVERYEILKDSLLMLTSAVAGMYKRSGGNSHPATDLYVTYENECLLEQIAQLKSPRLKKLAIDLGCGTGRVSRFLAPHFESVIGYDISQDMTAEAYRRDNPSNVNYESQQDLEEGIPLGDASVGLVVMSIGTGSDIRDIEGLVKEIKRVLFPGGRFLLSFYNKDALIYSDGYVSLDSGLAAEINVDEECLTVHVSGHLEEIPEKERTNDVAERYVPSKDYLVYARAYSQDEIVELLGKSLYLDSVVSYPTLSTVVPRVLLSENNKEFVEHIRSIDATLLNANNGAYHVVTGRCP